MTSLRNLRLRTKPASRGLGCAFAAASALFLCGLGLSPALAQTTTTTVPAAADSYLRRQDRERNFGAASTLRFESGPNTRTVVRFDTAAVAAAVGSGRLVSAELELFVVANGGSWGGNGRRVLAHRLTAEWAEPAVTWNCAIDGNPANSQRDCATSWDGGALEVAATASASALHTNQTLGRVRFDVTADVAAFSSGAANHGWLLLKDEATGGGGRLDYAARESGANGPRLVLTIEPASGDATPPMLAFTAPAQGETIYNEPAPEIRVEYSDPGADAASGVDLATLAVAIDGFALDCTASATAATCRSILLAAGPHRLTASLLDRAGNRAEAERAFATLEDREPPQIAFTSPARPSYFLDQGPAITGTLVDSGATPAGLDLSTFRLRVDGVEQTESCSVAAGAFACPAPALGEGTHTLAIEIADRAGNSSEASATYALVVDARGPALAITAPSGVVRGSNRPRIVVEFSDAPAGVDAASFALRLDGVARTASCQLFASGAECDPGVLGEGQHTIEAELSDLRGNSTAARVGFEISLALAVAIATPPSGSVTREPSIELAGTASPAATAVRLGSSDAPVALGAPVVDGRWEIAGVPLREGANALTVVATSPQGGVGTATISVVRDTEAPRVAILSPRDGFVTSGSEILVAGEVVDSVPSTAVASPLEVRVNGVAAAVELESFVLPQVLLQPGENTIEVIAQDGAGNVGRRTVTVRSVPDALARIEEIAGNFQQGSVRSTLPQPLAVRVVDFLGRPLAGRTVEFAVTRGDGSVLSFPEAARKLAIETDAEGIASVQFALGGRAGAGNHEVTASSVGIPGSVVFCASGRPGTARQIQPIVGTDFQGAKTGAVGQALAKPLLVQVFDEWGNPVAGTEVTYRIEAGGGGFESAAAAPTEPLATESTVTTDREGKASAVVILGPEEGVNANRISATFEGNPSDPAQWAVSGLIPGPAEATAIAGVLLDPEEGPVPGARIYLGEGASLLETVTDAAGRFRLAGVPVGTVHLHIDGSTVTRPGVWPPLAYELVTISGRENELGKPLRLPRIDAGSVRRVGGSADVEIPIAGVAGASLLVSANSATFPDGSREGEISFSQVPSWKVPMVAPMNTNFQLAWTIQPAGVKFDPPARISIPNFGGLDGTGNSPGMTVEIFSFDHDLEEFVSAGTATISEDGQRMVSNPGMGIAKTGWGGCPRPPAPPAGACDAGRCSTCPLEGGPPVSTCDECSQCTGSGCEPRQIPDLEVLVQPLDEQGGEGEGASTARAISLAESAAPTRQTTPSGSMTLEIHQEGMFDARKQLGIPAKCKKINYRWDFGDGMTSTDEKPKHRYKKRGTYRVRVEAMCQDCPTVGTKDATTTIKVEGQAKIDQVISAQLGPGIDCNRLPTAPGVKAGKNNPMLMGATSGTRAEVDLAATISSKFAREVTYFAARQAGSSDLLGTKKAAASGNTLLSFEAEDGENEYEVVVGFDENENQQLETDEIEQTFPQKVTVITASDHAENANQTDNLGALFPLGGVAGDLLDFFLAQAGGVPKATGATQDVVTAAELTHPTGVAWAPGCSGSVTRFHFDSPGVEAEQFAKASPTFNTAWTAFKAARMAQIDAAVRPIALGATVDVFGPVALSQVFGTRTWLNALEPDIALAFGGLNLQGTIVRARFRKMGIFSGVFAELIEFEFRASFRDVYDFDFFVDLIGPVGTESAALTQAGNPSLGPAGRVFVDRLSFDTVLRRSDGDYPQTLVHLP